MRTKVVGLSCDIENVTVPTVLLKGAGEAATSLLAEAQRAADVPIIKDPALLNALYRIPIEQPIGRELFPVMAALIAHVLSVDGERREAMK